MEAEQAKIRVEEAILAMKKKDKAMQTMLASMMPSFERLKRREDAPAMKIQAALRGCSSRQLLAGRKKEAAVAAATLQASLRGRFVRGITYRAFRCIDDTPVIRPIANRPLLWINSGIKTYRFERFGGWEFPSNGMVNNTELPAMSATLELYNHGYAYPGIQYQMHMNLYTWSKARGLYRRYCPHPYCMSNGNAPSWFDP